MSELPPLNAATLWGILRDEVDDTTTNHLVWHYLGYRQDASGEWNADGVDAAWREKFPEPPDFIENRPPNVQLTRSIPKENKQLLKEQLGFEGYKLNELIPRKTRRATMTNWLLSYMRDHGITL
ncbi:DUF1823 family protein [filamentous cyanobacterium LEGE 11480]|uniref:DUF1823 family protein n=1 Tax=Romeriopsis navalis LEGE 11480 TaxID=2777977 RepID=A0A928Z415_9CYAN|nr:DUF1823 family protein [Romeriopsis navalis]MBE9032086.1 DUF1823 family protein [Romeriopsis navalis LEGE 11480]